MVVIHVNDGYISYSVTSDVISNGQIPFYVCIAHDMYIFTHVKVLGNLMFYQLHIIFIAYWLWLSSGFRMDSDIRMGFFMTACFCCPDLRKCLLCKIVFLLGRHGIPFIGITVHQNTLMA